MKPQDLRPLVVAAAERTARAQTARVSHSSRLGDPEPKEVDRRGEGVADFAQRRVLVGDRLVTDRMLNYLSREKDDRPRRWLKGALVMQTEMLFDGGNRLVSSGDGTWLDDGDSPSGPRSEQDPLWLLDALAGANDDVVSVGADEVRGASTARYRLSVNLPAARTRADHGLRIPTSGRRRWFRWKEDGPMEDVPVELWLDGEGRVRRMSRLAVPATKPAEEPLWTMTELWDFGTAIDIPDPATLRTLTDTQARRTRQG